LDIQQQTAIAEEPRDAYFTHRMFKPDSLSKMMENAEIYIGQTWDDIFDLPSDDEEGDFAEIMEMANQKVKKSNEAAAAIVAAEKLAAEEAKKKEEELVAAKAAKEKEEWDKAEFERLKQKFQ